MERKRPGGYLSLTGLRVARPPDESAGWNGKRPGGYLSLTGLRVESVTPYTPGLPEPSFFML
jgi:hypothetical protein